MYLALARKYRPQKFSELIGQPHITRTLQNSIKMERLYPCLIFSGMKGVGKTSTARILAKAINCEQGPATEPCNECPYCIEITKDISPDYIEIDGASNNGVEEVRNLKEKVKYRPLKSRFRVIVIDEVHMLSNSAWNALLKTIEEPPPHTYFILATTDFHKIPATILSRSQHFEFKRIPKDIIARLLKEISIKEKIKISEYALFLIANIADGSLRDGKKIFDQAIALSSGDIDDDKVIDILGIIEEDLFIDLIKNVFEKNRKNIIEIINSISEKGTDLRFFYNEFLKFFRDLMILKFIGASKDLCNFNPENVEKLNMILSKVSEVELLRYFNTAKDLEITMKNTENPHIILEYMFLKLSYFPSLKNIEDVISEINSGEDISGSKEPADYDIFPDNQSSNEVIRQENISADSPAFNKTKLKIIEQVKQNNPRLASILSEARMFLEKNVLYVEIKDDMKHVMGLVKEKAELIKGTALQFSNIKKVSIYQKKQDKTVKEQDKSPEEDKVIKNLSDKIKARLISIEDI